MCLKTSKKKQKKDKKIVKKFALYETVRQLGYYNMQNPRARKLTRLTKKDYNYIIEHYSKLISKYPDITECVKYKIENLKQDKITKLDTTKSDLYNNCKKL